MSTEVSRGGAINDELVDWTPGLDPAEALARYRVGWFPLPLGGGYGWFHPSERAVFVVGRQAPRVTRSTRRAGRSLEVRVSEAPLEVVALCRTTPRPGGWIDDGLVALYRAFAEVGALLAIEVRDDQGARVGGLFGVALGELLVGESMVSVAPNASKVAFTALAQAAASAKLRVIDGQWPTPHLLSLGFVTMERSAYEELRRSLRLWVGSGLGTGLLR